jgi:hypothetical protein
VNHRPLPDTDGEYGVAIDMAADTYAAAGGCGGRGHEQMRDIAGAFVTRPLGGTALARSLTLQPFPSPPVRPRDRPPNPPSFRPSCRPSFRFFFPSVLPSSVRPSFPFSRSLRPAARPLPPSALPPPRHPGWSVDAQDTSAAGALLPDALFEFHGQRSITGHGGYQHRVQSDVRKLDALRQVGGTVRTVRTVRQFRQLSERQFRQFRQPLL